MHIIFVASYGTAPRSFAVGRFHLILLAAILLSALLGVGFSIQALFKAWAVDSPIIRVETPRASARETLALMAEKLGEMEAQLLRLDTFSDRLSKLLSPSAAGAVRALPKVHPLPTSTGNDLESMKGHLNAVSQAIDERQARLDRLEAVVIEERAHRESLPTIAPIPEAPHSSDYGARVDPFDGHASFHAGIDFVAPYGTRFSSAAAGVVVSVRHVPDFGNVIEIDHGNGIHTLYAHAARILVREGDGILKGQSIGEVGSTGRSTGPHLHFEVHENGQATNPQKFLRLDS